MRICIYGAGAIGGFLAGYLGKAGHDVSVIARGAHKDAMRLNGLVVQHNGAEFTTRPTVPDSTSEIGPVDVVIVTAKGPALPSVAEGIGPLIGPETAVIFAMNGIPWWYDHGRPTETGAADLLDPTGGLRRVVGVERAIGCVVDCPTRVSAPGVIFCGAARPGKYTLGEPTGTVTDRLTRLSEAFFAAGLDAPVTEDIRAIVWAKLVVNLSRSPVAVLTGVDELMLSQDPSTAEIGRRMVDEGLAVAAAHGISLDVDTEALADPANRFVHKPSMLQDWEAGRPMEIDSIVTIVSRFGAAAGVPTPTVDLILGLVRCKAIEAGLYEEILAAN